MLGFNPISAAPLSASATAPVVLQWRRIAPAPGNTWQPVNLEGEA